ncbi:2'-5' RNA ligase family protein [Salinisphaera sp.]|uniref:2'-5' RNA ligase family protein n=1 Tax=Salinisphaera sp. TaxID=1914330 RepID=UPI002D77889C|nr:2'-5' RNA ligase family protein [Salinisphaera sp.]HET7313058.1 2'-5' RNA ligase family protein [Salinisphaera sp.]
MIGADARQRLFFALWPPIEAAESMARIARTPGMAGTPVARDKLHVTLAFHGACDMAGRDALIARAERVRMPSMALAFDRLGGVAKARLRWLELSHPPPGLLELAAFLRGPGLDRHRFVPHITLCRKAETEAACALAPIAWRATEFVLAESGAHGVAGEYRTIARWPLGGAGGPGSNME